MSRAPQSLRSCPRGAPSGLGRPGPGLHRRHVVVIAAAALGGCGFELRRAPEMHFRTLALTGFGIPHIAGLSGFYSKDAIIEAAHAAHTPGDYAFWLLVIAALMTSFYSWRLMFMTFHGPTRADAKTFKHAHESPAVMLVPLAVLALGAVVAGAATPFFIGEGQHEFWGKAIFNGEQNHILHAMHEVPMWVKSPVLSGPWWVAWPSTRSGSTSSWPLSRMSVTSV